MKVRCRDPYDLKRAHLGLTMGALYEVQDTLYVLRRDMYLIRNDHGNMRWYFAERFDRETLI